MTLRLIPLPASDPGRVDLELLASSRKTDTTGGTVPGDVVLSGAALYGIEQHGDRLMTLALAAGRSDPLRELWILGAVGVDAHRPVLRPALDLIERESAQRFDVLSLQTKRIGLVKLLTRRGYTVDAFTLRKRLNALH